MSTLLDNSQTHFTHGGSLRRKNDKGEWKLQHFILSDGTLSMFSDDAGKCERARFPITHRTEAKSIPSSTKPAFYIETCNGLDDGEEASSVRWTLACTPPNPSDAEILTNTWLKHIDGAISKEKTRHLRLQEIEEHIYQVEFEEKAKIGIKITSVGYSQGVVASPGNDKIHPGSILLSLNGQRLVQQSIEKVASIMRTTPFPICLRLCKPWAKEGPLCKQSRGQTGKPLNWRERKFELRAFTLIYNDLDDNKKGEIALEGCSVENCESPGREFCFKITEQGRERLVMQSKTEQEKDEWMVAIQRNLDIINGDSKFYDDVTRREFSSIDILDFMDGSKELTQNSAREYETMIKKTKEGLGLGIVKKNESIVITRIRRDLVGSVDLEDVIIGINDTDITDLNFTQVIQLMGAVPSDSIVRLRIRRPKKKTQKQVNIDSWISTNTAEKETEGDDDYVNVHVVFSMPLTFAGDGDDIMLADEQLDIPSPLASATNDFNTESLMKQFERRKSSAKNVLQSGKSDLDKAEDSLHATHISDIVDADDSWKLLSASSFPEMESKKVVTGDDDVATGDDDDFFQHSVEKVFKILTRFSEKLDYTSIQLDSMIKSIYCLEISPDLQNKLVSLLKEISLDANCITREEFLQWFQADESRKDLLSILLHVADLGGKKRGMSTEVVFSF